MRDGVGEHVAARGFVRLLGEVLRRRGRPSMAYCFSSGHDAHCKLRAAMTFRIAPSILSADFARLGEEVRAVVEGRRRPDPLRRDGQPLRARTSPSGRWSARRSGRTSSVPLDVHLMVQAGRPPRAGLRQGGREHHQLPSRGLRPRRPHASRSSRSTAARRDWYSTRRRRSSGSTTRWRSSTSCSSCR